MCMICDGSGNILVQKRNDPSWSGITFPGGHVEYGEMFYDSVIREVKEETGLDIESPRICGIKQFRTANDERYVVILYKTDRFSGEIVSSDEGEVFWIKRSELENYELADGFYDMLAVFESDDVNEIFYFRDDGELKWRFG